MVRLARASGMRVYGPNSPGLANIADRVLLSMSPVAGADVTSGPVGLVTQGGGIGRALMQWMDRGLGHRAVVLARQRGRPGHRRLRQPYG